MPGSDYHRFIYEVTERRIRGDFEGAYAHCEDVWPTQHQLDLPHFVYIKGLVRDRSRELGRAARVLDIVCGYGDLIHELGELGDSSALGIEISHTAAKGGRQRFGAGLNIVVGDLNQGLPTPDASFDVILVLGVFWFLLDRVEFCLDELERVAAASANLVFTLHMPANPIGKEIISSYDDFLSLLGTRFDVVDGFKFYQPQALNGGQPLDETLDDVLVRCRKRNER